jgi:hypothetical protein
MALLQGTKKLFGPLQDDLDCVSAVKKAMELKVEACMKEEDEVAAATITQAPFSQGKDILKAKRASLADETFEMLMFMRSNKHHVRFFGDLWMTWTASVPLKTNKHHATISLQIFLIVNSPIN